MISNQKQALIMGREVNNPWLYFPYVRAPKILTAERTLNCERCRPFSTGLPTLDNALGGGLLPGTFALIAGPNVCAADGKTALVQKIIMSQPVNCASFDADLFHLFNNSTYNSDVCIQDALFLKRDDDGRVMEHHGFGRHSPVVAESIPVAKALFGMANCGTVVISIMQNDSTVSSTAKALLAVCEVVLWISRGTGRKAIDDDDPNLYRIEILKNQYASCLEKRLARQCIDQDGNPRCDRHFGSKKVLFVRDYERLGLREVEY